MRRNARKAGIRFYQDAKKGWRWRAVSFNGNIVADGGQGYSSKQAAMRGARATYKALISWSVNKHLKRKWSREEIH